MNFKSLFLSIMERHSKFICIGLLSFALVQNSIGGTYDNEVEEESNPLLDIASAFLQETGQGNGNGLAAVGGLVSSFMQSDAAKQIGDALTGGGSNGGSGAGELLSGLSSLLAGAGGAGGRGGIDPSTILNMVQMFSGMASQTNTEHAKTKRPQKSRQAPPAKNEIGLDSILAIASSFMNAGKDRSTDHNNPNINIESMMSVLSTVASTFQAFTGPEAAKREAAHNEHSYMLPPIFETLHIYSDHFMNSELGQAIWRKSGLKELTASFADEKGNLDHKRMFDMMENLSFRRKWIKTATAHIAKWIAHVADPEVQARYMKTFEVVGNGLLKSYGYPKSAFLDATRPEESLTSFADAAIRRHFEVKVDSGAYIKPAVAYVKELVKLGEARGYLGKLNSEELSDKVTDTLNLDIIEPFLKVYRGYRYASSNTECAAYVLCELNSIDPRDSKGLPSFKTGLTKLSSFAAAWFLSSESEHNFFTLYGAANTPVNCQKKYQVNCSDFHAGEDKVTTEYFHNEL